MLESAVRRFRGSMEAGKYSREIESNVSSDGNGREPSRLVDDRFERLQARVTRSGAVVARPVRFHYRKTRAATASRPDAGF